MRILLTSGLYDACEEINIGCLGSQTEKDLFEIYFINLYPKLKIKYYSGNPEEYEFPTIKLIECDNSQYAGFYFHAKGVSKSFETVVNHWRAALNERVINQWRTHYNNILNGFDVSSVNHLNAPAHFSGNYWWFNREYIKRLPLVDTLNHSYRWHAEQWICMTNGKFWYPEFIEPSTDFFLMDYKK
jgi:hypothetical protein